MSFFALPFAQCCKYLQRLKSVEERRDRIAERLKRQHRSIGCESASNFDRGRFML